MKTNHEKDFEAIRKATCDCMSLGLATSAHEARMRIADRMKELETALAELVQCDPETAFGRGLPTARRAERFASARALVA